MRDDFEPLPAGAEGRADFTTTCWSAVLRAGANDSTEAQAALARLCRTYWYPLYAYVRRKGRSEPDAQDLVQGFFAQLLGRGALRRVMPHGGRFRSYLLAR
jgi:RNA polymerase sigma-70 factor (ECF subfamily)